MFKVGGTTLSAPQTAAYFAGRNQIEVPATSVRVSPSGRRRSRPWVERAEHRQDGHPPVLLYTVHGGGHTVPGPTRAPRVLGRTSSDISTADLIANAFAIMKP